jgi:hypothetical protein
MRHVAWQIISLTLALLPRDVLSPGQPWATDERRVSLVPNPQGTSVDFDTESMAGTIRLDGAYHGVTRLWDKRTGKQLIDARYSALNLFKLHAVNQYMGQPRTMQRTTKLSPQAVEVTWPATPAHKAEITARYEVIAPAAVAVTVTVRSHGTYPAYEVFMPSYFDKSLRPHVYLEVARGGGKAPQWVLPVVNDVFRGTLLVFPRDAHVARHCLDGRWDRDENDAPNIPQTPVRRYAQCLALMADPEKQVAAVLMADPRHCYAISTRYHADNDADRLTPYSAFDLSLFGDDLLPGDVRIARVRLALTPLDDDLSQPLKLYQAFLAETAAPNQAVPNE